MKKPWRKKKAKNGKKRKAKKNGKKRNGKQTKIQLYFSFYSTINHNLAPKKIDAF